MPPREPRKTRTDAVYEGLRAEILGGQRAPGSRLKFPELGAAFGVSVGAIREALTRLAAEGLVSTEAHQGFAVTALSVERLQELTDARIELECLVLARSIRDGDLAWESQVVAAHHRLERSPFLTADDPVRITDEWVEAHGAFHRALLDGCANRRLFQLAEGLRHEAELYRRWSQPLGHERHRDLGAEHRELLETALAHDPDAAVRSLTEHISHTTRLLLAVAESAG